MFREIDADCYIMTDGDDTYPAKYCPQIEEAIVGKRADMVSIGDGFLPPILRKVNDHFIIVEIFLSEKWLIPYLRRMWQILWRGYGDLVESLSNPFPLFQIISKGFEIETEMTIFALDANFQILEIPIDYRDRPEEVNRS